MNGGMKGQKHGNYSPKPDDVAFEDVDYFLEEGLVDGVVITGNDNAILHISRDGDAFVFRRNGLLFVSHKIGDFSLRTIPAQR